MLVWGIFVICLVFCPRYNCILVCAFEMCVGSSALLLAVVGHAVQRHILFSWWGSTSLRWDVEPRCVLGGGCSRKAGVEQRCVVMGLFEGGDWSSSCSCSAKDVVAEARAVLLGLQQRRREVDRQSVDEVIVIYERGSVASCLPRVLRQDSMARQDAVFRRLIELVVYAVDDLAALVPVVTFRHRQHYPRLCRKRWAPDVLANQGNEMATLTLVLAFAVRMLVIGVLGVLLCLGMILTFVGLLVTLRVGRPQELSGGPCDGDASLACSLPCSVEQAGEPSTFVASADVGGIDGVSCVAASSLAPCLAPEPVQVLCVALHAFPADGFVVDDTTQYLTFERNALVHHVCVDNGSRAISWIMCGNDVVWWHSPTWSWGTCGCREGWFPTDYVVPFHDVHAA